MIASTLCCRTGTFIVAGTPRRRHKASRMVLHKIWSRGFCVQDKIEKKLKALQRLTLVVRSSLADSNRKEANSKGGTGSTSR